MPKALKNIALTIAMLLSALAAPLHAFEVRNHFQRNSTSPVDERLGSATTAVKVSSARAIKVYLNYDFVSNSADKNQGDFSGAGTINNDGVMVAGTLQGIWQRR